MVHIATGVEVDEARLATFRERFPEATFSSVVDDPGSIATADAYIGRIPAEVYANASDRLTWVHSTGAGIETIIAIPELVASDIVVTNTRGAHAPFVAEHTFALLLALTRRLPYYDEQQRNHHYHAYGRGLEMESVYGKRMLIIGMGNIGSAIAKRALGFEMTVVGVDLRVPDHLAGDVEILPMEHLDTELPKADVVVVAVPHTADTSGLLHAERIGALKDGAILIGISRGRIIDEPALAARLREGSLWGAGLDVFTDEPLPEDHFLWDTPRLVITPHCAPVSPLTRDREFEITMENIRRFLADEPLLNMCDKVAGF